MVHLARLIGLLVAWLLAVSAWAQVSVSGTVALIIRLMSFSPWEQPDQRIVVFERGWNPATLSGDLYVTRSGGQWRDLVRSHGRGCPPQPMSVIRRWSRPEKRLSSFSTSPMPAANSAFIVPVRWMRQPLSKKDRWIWVGPQPAKSIHT